jgi:hypothetical protein
MRRHDPSSVIQKISNFCHTLRDDDVGYGDYLEQLIYLLFLGHLTERPPFPAIIGASDLARPTLLAP